MYLLPSLPVLGPTGTRVWSSGSIMSTCLRSSITRANRDPSTRISGGITFQFTLSGEYSAASSGSAARTGETLGATWDEIDLDEKLWTIPAARMKAGAEHKVPLSDEAITLLRTLPRTVDGNPHLFPGPRAKTLSNMAMLQCLRGIRDDGATVHGFRASFSTWAREQTDFSPEIIEAALAHTQSDKVVAAYARTTFLDRRRELMQVWAGFCMGG